MNSTRVYNKKIPFIMVLITVVLAFLMLIGSVAAWLIKQYNHNSTDNQIGAIEVELYADGVMINTLDTPYVLPGSSTIRTLNLKMRNNGTIDALVRATITIYYIDTNNNKVVLLVSENTPGATNICNIETTDWVYDFANGETAGQNVAGGGQMFYNKKLSPYTYKEIPTDMPGGNITSTNKPANEIPLIKSISLHENLKDEAIYVDVTLDAIAYSGNIYKKLDNEEIELDNTKYSALPFGLPDTLPSGWTAWR